LQQLLGQLGEQGVDVTASQAVVSASSYGSIPKTATGASTTALSPPEALAPGAARGVAAAASRGGLILVTGASGFIASHIVKMLLDRGFAVRGTVRRLDATDRTAHLVALPGA